MSNRRFGQKDNREPHLWIALGKEGKEGKLRLTSLLLLSVFVVVDDLDRTPAGAGIKQVVT